MEEEKKPTESTLSEVEDAVMEGLKYARKVVTTEELITFLDDLLTLYREAKTNYVHIFCGLAGLNGEQPDKLINKLLRYMPVFYKSREKQKEDFDIIGMFAVKAEDLFESGVWKRSRWYDE